MIWSTRSLGQLLRTVSCSHELLGFIRRACTRFVKGNYLQRVLLLGYKCIRKGSKDVLPDLPFCSGYQ